MAERRRAEEALQQQKAIVEAADRTKDHFLAMLSSAGNCTFDSVLQLAPPSQDTLTPMDAY